MTLLQYAVFRLAVKNRTDGFLSNIHLAGRVFHQYCVDLFHRIEGDRLNFQKNHQDLMRGDSLRALRNAVESGETAANTGRGIVLNSSFVGSRRYYDEKYRDCMAIVAK